MLKELLNMMTISVSQLNEYAGRLIANDEMLQGLLVEGEISNFKAHSSGHWYFTLKDEQSSVRCVMFRQYNRTVGFRPADGMKVVVGGGANLYLRDGAFQLYAQTMANAGLGRLYEQFEALKTKLAAEGLFDAAHKKPLPRFPRRIGVVTSPTGAVIRDIIHVSTRRNPGVDLLLVPCRVQGDGAAEEMISALETLWQTEGVDVILIGRGGGSLEDLWEFNRENLARAIYRSPVPVVSCVGHETDTTIADYVSDLRAPTPSAAAELAVPLVEGWQQTVDAWMDGMAKQIHRAIERTETRLALYTRSGPMVQFPMKLSQYEEKTAQWQKQIEKQALHAIDKAEQRLMALTAEVYALSPQHALKKGYAILRDETGALISSVAQAEPGAVFTAYLADGTRRAAWQTEEE
jgi:exodeoxyribonuclease VII large subunit